MEASHVAAAQRDVVKEISRALIVEGLLEVQLVFGAPAASFLSGSRSAPGSIDLEANFPIFGVVRSHAPPMSHWSLRPLKAPQVQYRQNEHDANAVIWPANSALGERFNLIAIFRADRSRF